MPLISLDKVCLSFGHHKLLDQLDFQFDLGERIALIGRNGGGKSSLLRILADEIKPDDGTVLASASFEDILCVTGAGTGWGLHNISRGL